MKKIRWSWKKLISRILWYFSLNTEKEEDQDYFLIRVNKKREVMASLIERSGVKDIESLITTSLALFTLVIDKELQGGSIDVVEPNGVNKEKLELLRHINRDDDSWKDWGEAPEE